MSSSPSTHLVDCTFCGARGLPVPFQASTVRCDFCSGIIPINTSYWQMIASPPPSPTHPYPYTQVPVVSEPGISDLEKAQIEIAIQKSLQESKPARRVPSVTDDDLDLALVLSLTEEEQKRGSSAQAGSTTPPTGPSTSTSYADLSRPVSSGMAALGDATSAHGKDMAEESDAEEKLVKAPSRRRKTADEVARELQQELQLDDKATGPAIGYPVLPPVTKAGSEDTSAVQVPGPLAQSNLSAPQQSGEASVPSPVPGIPPSTASSNLNLDAPSPAGNSGNASAFARPGPGKNDNGWTYPAVNPFGRP